jgi:hypothetical protein
LPISGIYDGELGWTRTSARVVRTILVSIESGRVSVKRKVTRIAPWQAGKVFALIYFLFGLVFAIPFSLIALFVAPAAGQPPLGFGLGFAIGLPFLYGIAGLIFVPIACWVYNFVATLVGGLEVNVEATADS